MTKIRDFRELSDTGLLWLINRVVFHPRGYALALVTEDGKMGWRLMGDGTEVFSFGEAVNEDEMFAAAQKILSENHDHQ